MAEKAAKGTRDISAIMRHVHSRDTAPEIRFREALDAAEIDYQAEAADLPGKPDIIVPASRLAIFIDGDYWHGNQWRRRKLTALEDQFKETSSKTYWLEKIRRNMQQDYTTIVMRASGWTVSLPLI